MRDLIESNLLRFHLIITNQLTGIYNRTYFNEKVRLRLKMQSGRNANYSNDAGY